MRPATGWIANRTFIPFARNRDVISDIAYCAFATAIPYPTTCHPTLMAAQLNVSRTYKDDIVSICQCLYDIIYVCLRYLTFDLVVLRGCRRSSAGKEDICKRTIHSDALHFINTFRTLNKEKYIP